MNAQTKIEPSLIGALAKALPELESAKKNKANPAFKSKYADIGAVIEAIEPIAKHGLWFRQAPVQIEGGIGIETFYIHVSGQEMSAGITPVPVNKHDAQGLGSAMKYGRRYGLETAFGLATEDDDGNAAVKAKPEATAEPAPSEMPDAEYSKLANLLKATSTQAGPLLKHYKVANLRHLNIDDYTEAVGHLNTKLAKMAKEETDKKAAATNFAEELDDAIEFN